jgi:S1-C subfamily serine protease
MKRKRRSAAAHHVIRPHHHKPYRRRHLGLALFSLASVIVSAVMIGLQLAKQPALPSQNGQNSAATPVSAGDDLASLTFIFGYSVGISPDRFDVTANPSEQPERTLLSSDSSLSDWPTLSRATLSPKPGSVHSTHLASQLTIRSEPLDAFSPELDPRILLNLSPESIAATELSATSSEPIGTTDFTRYDFSTTLTSSTALTVYATVWHAVTANEHIIISLEGLAGSGEIPPAYASLLATISSSANLNSGNLQQLASDWITKSRNSRTYLSDLVSPAVVKLYHLACGTVTIRGELATDQQCRAVTGSGFIISNDGYIATNGHVAVYEPEDALVDALLDNPVRLAAYLSGMNRLSSEQIARLRTDPQQLAAVIADVYNLPDGTVAFAQKREVLLVALGSRQINPITEAEVEKLFSLRNSYDIKKARLVDHNYSGKDQLNLISGSDEGFTQSDVALLKIDVSNAPLLRLGQPADIAQGQSVSIIGFPHDAENALVDNDELAASITLGTISSIRTAAGGNARLFQTDTDASVGNSGGPGVSDSGQVLGLLTYRFKDDITQNAAKSYLRDVGDLRDLIERNNFILDTNSRVQAAWSEGLRQYSRGRLTRSIPLFEEVVKLYPAHRLAPSYIASAEQGIADGQDVAEYSAAVFYMGLLAGGFGLAIAMRLIARHHAHHHIYRAAYDLMPAIQTNTMLIPSKELVTSATVSTATKDQDISTE